MGRKKEKGELRVLVVDDHYLTREMVRMILKGIGFNDLTSVDNAQQAEQIILEGKVDLIICDWNMPRYNGFELLKRVRSLDPFKDLPFLMLTAEAYRESVTAAMQAGVTDYIAKPFTADVLNQKLNKIFAFEGA